MSVYFVTTTPFDPIFEFDGTITETTEKGYNVSKHPIEEQGEVPNYVLSEPRSWSIEGLVSSVQLAGVVSPTRMQDAKAAIEELADREDMVTLVLPDDEAEVIFKNVRCERTADGGEKYQISCELQEARMVMFATTQVSPSKLRAKRRRRTSNNPKGGQATPVKVDPDSAKGKKVRESGARVLKGGLKKALGG